jgi:hypothetical protein
MTSPPFGFFLCQVAFMTRGTHDNDNEPDSWCSIGLQAALIVNKLRLQAQLTEKQHPPENDNRPAHNEDKERAEKSPSAEAKYIEHRLRELAAWERRIGGNKN